MSDASLQVDMTIELWRSGGWNYDRAWSDGLRFFGEIVRRHPHFAIGDIVIGRFNNGQAERWPVTGWSTSRNQAIKDYYVDFQRWSWNWKREAQIADKMVAAGRRDRMACLREVTFKRLCFTGRTRGLLLTPPDDLTGRPSSDPAVRAWLVSYAEGRAADRVTANSPVTFSVVRKCDCHPDPATLEQLVCRACGRIKAPGEQVVYGTDAEVAAAMLATLGAPGELSVKKGS